MFEIKKKAYLSQIKNYVQYNVENETVNHPGAKSSLNTSKMAMYWKLLISIILPFCD